MPASAEKGGGETHVFVTTQHSRKMSYYFQVTHKAYTNNLRLSSDGTIFCNVLHIAYISTEDIF